MSMPPQRGPTSFARLKAQMRSRQVQDLEDFEEHKRREIQALKDWDRERRRLPKVSDVDDEHGVL